jgi:hypothetical protein
MLRASLIILAPSHRSGLARSLDAALAQTVRDVEIIVVNAGGEILSKQSSIASGKPIHRSSG